MRDDGVRGWKLLLSAAGQDRGAASILVLAIGLVLVMGGSAGAAVVNVRGARADARDAADLGGLAGAQRAPEGAAPACTRAAAVVEANGSHMSACRLDDQILELVVETAVPFLGPTAHVTATARAGPTA
jgi:secretion/DNA translocation related TadE-like protein